MATLSKGYAFGATEEVTAAKLSALVDSATITNILTAEIADSQITNVKIADVSAAKITNASSLPAGAGVFPTANLPAFAMAGANSDLTSLTGLTGDVYNMAWTSYGSTSTITGWSSYTAQNIYYKKIGKLVFVNFSISGTSNFDETKFTLPFTPATGSSTRVAIHTVNNGGDSASGVGRLSAASTTFTCYRTWGEGDAWTASGTKTIEGQFWFNATA